MNQNKEHDSIPIENLEIMAFADLAAGSSGLGKKSARARQSIIVVGRDYANRFFELSSWAGFDSPTAFRDRIIASYDEWRPKRFGIEANGMQVLFGALVREQAKVALNYQAMFVPIYQPTRIKKEYRIRTGLEPVINNGRLFIQSKSSELAVELRSFPTGNTKDMVDALETCIRMFPKVQSRSSQSDSADQYAAYLRSTGCDPSQIAEKLRKFKLERG